MDYVWYSPKYDELIVMPVDECKENKSCNWLKCPMTRMDYKGNFLPETSEELGMGISCTQIPLDAIYFIGEV